MNERICLYSKPYPDIKSYYEMIDTAVSLGISAVEGFSYMDFLIPDREKTLKIKEYADERNIKFPCFSVYINLVGDNSKEEIKRLKAYADTAKLLGSPFLHHTICCEIMDSSKVLPFKEEYFKKGIESVREIYDYCESIGIKAIYEEQGYLFNGVKGIERFINEVNREISLVADFGNIFQSGDSVSDYIKAFLPRFVHAHIKDAVLTQKNHTGNAFPTLNGMFMNEVPPGEGTSDIRENIKLLEKGGYNGYYGIEFTARNDADDYKRAIHLIDTSI